NGTLTEVYGNGSVNPPTAYNSTVSFATLAAGNSYDVQLLYTNSTVITMATGTLTVTAGVAGHYVTQQQQVWVPENASDNNTTPAAFASVINANPGSAPISLSTTVTQSTVTNVATSTVTPTILQTVDRWGNVLSVTDPRLSSFVTKYTYNANNQVLTQTLPDT